MEEAVLRLEELPFPSIADVAVLSVDVNDEAVRVSRGSISSRNSSSTIHGRFPTPHERRIRHSGHTSPAHLDMTV
ncbi:hypothetical protein OG609_42575 [Streptomyces sp. NBC_01224]|uniref:hypothetical protein n=1 Tax=Streptomyces sp. NBC_01224 TaxID=2903783 RepID=UPI002E1442A6|nr:hypothetical protein OG609_42575 [Streptomyces sp. NBC_01224]